MMVLDAAKASAIKCGYQVAFTQETLVLYPSKDVCKTPSDTLQAVTDDLRTQQFITESTDPVTDVQGQMVTKIRLMGGTQLSLRVLPPPSSYNIAVCFTIMLYAYGWIAAPAGWAKLWCLLALPALYWGIKGIAVFIGLPVD